MVVANKNAYTKIILNLEHSNFKKFPWGACPQIPRFGGFHSITSASSHQPPSYPNISYWAMTSCPICHIVQSPLSHYCHNITFSYFRCLYLENEIAICDHYAFSHHLQWRLQEGFWKLVSLPIRPDNNCSHGHSLAATAMSKTIICAYTFVTTFTMDIKWP